MNQAVKKLPLMLGVVGAIAFAAATPSWAVEKGSAASGASAPEGVTRLQKAPGAAAIGAHGQPIPKAGPGFDLAISSLLLLHQPGQMFLKFMAGAKDSHFNERVIPAGDFSHLQG